MAAASPPPRPGRTLYFARTSMSPRPAAWPASRKDVFVRVVALEDVKVGVRGGRQTLDPRADAGVDVDGDQRDGHAEIEPIRQSVRRREHHRIGGEVERERRLDEVALERGIQQAAVADLGAVLDLAAAVGVLDVEVDLALPQVLAFEGVVGRSLVGDAQASALAADRQRALGEERTEALAAAAEGPERRVDRCR